MTPNANCAFHQHRLTGQLIFHQAIPGLAYNERVDLPFCDPVLSKQLRSALLFAALGISGLRSIHRKPRKQRHAMRRPWEAKGVINHQPLLGRFGNALKSDQTTI